MYSSHEETKPIFIAHDVPCSTSAIMKPSCCVKVNKKEIHFKV